MRYLYVLWAVSTFLLFFLLLFPLFIFFSLWGKSGRKAIWYLIKTWSYIWFFLIGIRPKISYAAPISKHQNYIVVANHASYMDTPLIFRTLPFMVRPLAKAELARIPLFGFLYKQMAVLVDRSSSGSKRKSVQHLRRTLQREGSIFIFPEGTFNESDAPLKSFYDGAFRLALVTQTPILPVLFPDAVNRWHYSGFWQWSPGLSRTVFLPAISPEGFAKNDIEGFKKKVFDTMWGHLAELKAKDNP